MVEPIDIRTGKPFQSRRQHLHHPPSDGASLGGGLGRARGLMGGAFMGCMMALQGREPSIWRYDGKMHFWYSLNEENFNGGVVTFKFRTVSGTATVNWGDGTTSTMSGTTISHTYAAIGDYEVVVDGFSSVLLGDYCWGNGNTQVVRIEMGSPFEMYQSGAWYHFRNLPSLTRVNLNGYSMAVPALCFDGDTSLEAVDDARFSAIGQDGFLSCPSLTSAGDLSACASFGDRAFYKCGFDSIGDLPACTYIGQYAFYECQSLTSVGNLPVCTTIMDRAFFFDTALVSVGDMPLCTKISANVFNECTSLVSIGDLSALTSVGGGSFSYTTSLTSLTFSSRTHTEVEGITGFANFPQRRTCVFHCADGDYYRSGTSLLPVT